MTDSTQLRLKRWRYSTFLVAIIGYIGYYICRANLSAAFPLMSSHFGYTNAELGLIALYSEISYAIGKFINGPLGDKVGGKKIFLLGLAGAIISNFVFSLGSNLIFFIVTWCVCRYFLSMGWGGLTKMIGHWFEPEKNGTVMGWVSLNFQFGGVVATLFAGMIVSMGGDWQDVFIYPPILATIILIFSALGSKDSPQDVVPGTSFGQSTTNKTPVFTDQSESSWQVVKNLLSLRLFQQLLVFSFLTTFLRSIFFFWTAKFLVDIGFEAAKGIFMSAIFPFLGCLGTVILGWYTDHHAKNGDRAQMMWIMLSGLVVSLLLIIWALGFQTINQTLISSLLALCGFFLLGPYSMSSGALTLDIAGPQKAGTCTGLIDGLGYFGGALAVWMAGKISDELGWVQVFFLLTFMAFLSTLAAWMMSREFKKRYSQGI